VVGLSGLLVEGIVLRVLVTPVGSYFDLRLRPLRRDCPSFMGLSKVLWERI
jgi:hypothetical protein